MNCNMFWHFLYSKSFPMIQAAQSSEERERSCIDMRLMGWQNFMLPVIGTYFWVALIFGPIWKPNLNFWFGSWVGQTTILNVTEICHVSYAKEQPKNFPKWNRSYQQHIDDTYMSCSTVAYSSLPSQSDGLLKDFHLLQYTFGSPNLGDTKCCRIKNILPHCLLRNTI